MSAPAAPAARVPGARALVRLQPCRPGLPSRRRAGRQQRTPIVSARAGEQPDEGPTAAAAAGSGGGEQQVAGDNADPSISSRAPRSSPITPSTKQTLEALDQLLGVEAQPAARPEPSTQQQPPQQQPPAAPQAKRMGEPQLTFYDPNEVSGLPEIGALLWGLCGTVKGTTCAPQPACATAEPSCRSHRKQPNALPLSIPHPPTLPRSQSSPPRLPALRCRPAGG